MIRLILVALVVYLPTIFLAVFNGIAWPFYKAYPYTSKWHEKLFYLPSDHLVKKGGVISNPPSTPEQDEG